MTAAQPVETTRKTSTGLQRAGNRIQLEDLNGLGISDANPLPVSSSTTNPTSVQFTPNSGNLDLFGRLRVSNPTAAFDSQNQYDTSPLFWESTDLGVAGTVTHLPNESGVQLSVTAGQSVVRQQRQYNRYQPGKSQLIICTFSNMNNAAGITKRAGYFDAANGIFYQVDETNPSITLRSNNTGTPSDARNFIQASWNIDTLDGSGDDNNPSGINLNTAAAEIFWIGLEWLGVGDVLCGFVINRQFVPVHVFVNSNSQTLTYMTTANLPIRYEIVSTTGSGDMTQVCSTVISEGGQDVQQGIPFTALNGTTRISVTTRRPILSIRPKTTFNSIAYRGLIIPQLAEVYSEDQNAIFEIVYGGTLTGPSWTDVNASASGIEQDVAASAIAGGIVVGGGFAIAGQGSGGRGAGPGQTSLASKLPLALTVAGAHPTTPFTDSLSVVVTSIPGTATDTLAFLTGVEVY